MNLALWARYLVERWMLRGSPAMLAMLLAVLSGIAVCGAIAAKALPGHHFETYGEALWWSVLRISDPGYLSDDIPDFGVRALSVTLSVLGMAVTVGGIVAIVSQVLNGLLANLAAATTPVPFSDHIVLFGWTDRTPHLLRELLKLRGVKIVVLLEKVGAHEVHLVSRSLPSRAPSHRVILRRGIPTRARDLERAGCQQARAIIIPATEEAVAGDPSAGAFALKSLLALRSHLSDSKSARPLVVMEVVERSLVSLAEATLPGVRVLHSDRVISRVLRLGLQGPGLLSLADRIVRPHSSWGLESVPARDHAGKTIGQVEAGHENGQLLGAVEQPGDGPLTLHPGVDHELSEDAELLVIHGPKPVLEGVAPPPDALLQHLDHPPLLHVLILGWSEVVPDLIAEMSMEPAARYKVDIVSEVPSKRRRKILQKIPRADRVQVSHIVSKSARLDSIEGLELGSYDRFLVPSDRSGLPGTADARTLAFVLDLNQSRSELKDSAYITIELLEQEDLGLFPMVESIISPELIAEVLISSALAPESHEALKKKLRLQQTYVTRVLPLDTETDIDLSQLRAALRRRNAALLDVVPGNTGAGGKRALPTRILAVVPTTNRTGSSASGRAPTP